MTVCRWCGGSFEPRRDGGKAQPFCSPACRRAYDQGARAWVRNAIAATLLTIEDLRKASRKTRALQGRTSEALTVSEGPADEARFI